MPSFSYSALAEADLYELLEYIAQDNIDAALRVEEAIERTAQLLADNPEIGHPVKSRFPHLRAFIVQPYNDYLLFFQIEEDGIHIQRILHGARDVSSLLNP
ncbi:type II toxin-antitoxin system RelE/ParE family toxin [Granulosicoccus sp. 3-233]|uniref:type II toxin-antitoxin system RelE/ParE family toxin n=1 Tax=Granulosicoccus sp. 3-233 TaxID=3417969 RepID=UPI003D343D73